ncbi:hypothetical protein [Mycolicibacterium sp. XJ1819]
MAGGYRITAPYFGEGEFAEHVERMKQSPEPSATESAMFLGLQQLSHIYAGTVPAEEVARRRRRNRRARWSRRGDTAALARDARRHRVRRGRRFARGQAPELNLGGAS